MYAKARKIRCLSVIYSLFRHSASAGRFCLSVLSLWVGTYRTSLKGTFTTSVGSVIPDEHTQTEADELTRPRTELALPAGDLLNDSWIHPASCLKPNQIIPTEKAGEKETERGKTKASTHCIVMQSLVELWVRIPPPVLQLFFSSSFLVLWAP